MFRTEPDGSVLWLPTTVEEAVQFKIDLLEEGTEHTSSSSLSEQVTTQLNSFANKILEGNSNLTRTNDLYLSTIKKMFGGALYPVDIVLPVYGGLHILKPSLQAIKDRTDYPYRLIIVDDCSPDHKTKKFLTEWQANNPAHTVIFQPKNKGFAASVNKGIRTGQGGYICVLNSDVLVTPNWLTKLVFALEASPTHAIVNPVTNNTAIIDIAMHPGLSYLDMNRGLEAVSSHRYPEIMPTGFCFMFKRELITKIGYFDEAYGSYGEESDFWMRTLSYADPNGVFPRYKAVLADDTYLYHERGSSFSALGTEQHMGIRRGGSERFNRIWPQFKSWRKHNKVENDIQYLKDELPKRVTTKESPYNIAFLVFSTAYCGGMAFIADIVNQLQEEGVNAKVVQINRDPAHVAPPTMGELRSGVISFESPKDAVDHFSSSVFDSGVIVAATNEMQQLAEQIGGNNPKLLNVLFSQSFDPALVPNDQLSTTMKEQYHKAPYIISNAKWLDETIKSITNRSTFGYVNPGVNSELFYPRGRDRGDDRPTVAFFLNSREEYRGFNRGLEAAFALHNISLQCNIDIRIVGIGVDAVQGAPFITCVGGMSQARIATFLSTEVDVICDPQTIHTYGMPSLEGMASGAVPVCWDNVGIHEFATNGIDSIILPKEATPGMVAQEIFNLLTNTSTLDTMKAEAVLVSKKHNRKVAVTQFIQNLEENFRLRHAKRKIFVVTPHLRKHGGPTTILHTAEALASLGHDVTLGCIYADINPEIIKETNIPISIKWQDPGKYDVIITNSDNPHNEHFSFAKWADKKVLLKLSHNPRFQKLEDDALKLEWDDICTSTNWLVNACAKPQVESGWTHPPREAHRVGWYHYGHKDFVCKYTDRKYFINGQMNILTLIHHHPTKGTPEALTALAAIKEKYGDKVNIFGVGEWPEFTKQCPPWMQYFLNIDRKSLAQIYRQMDFFLSASHSEGLGRMSLEAMSASCLVIKTPTGAEFEKDMVNCVVADGFTATDLANALDKLGSDEETFKRIVKEGFITAETLSDPGPYRETWARVIEDIYGN